MSSDYCSGESRHLTSLKMFYCFVIAVQLHQAETQKEMSFDKILVHVESSTTILTRSIVSLQLDVAEGSVGEVSGIVGVLNLWVEVESKLNRHEAQ